MRPTALLLALGLVAGCSGQPAPRSPATLPTPAPVDATATQVENPEYTNWRQFPVGTTVVRQSVTERGGNTTTSIDTFRLAESSEVAVAVEWQNTTSRTDGTPPRVNPPDTRKYAKSFGLPNGMTADDFRRPSPSAKLTREESVEVAGKKYPTSVYEWSDSTEAGAMAITVWFAPALPGRIAKQTMAVEKTATTTTDTVLSVSIPAAK